MSVDQVRAEAARRKLRIALVVTALDLELQAVVAHLTPYASVKGRDGAIYECGFFHDLGQDWLVIVAETGAGNHAAQSAVTNAHIQFDPELQIFVGVGGSRKVDVPIGSVVAADHVYMPYGGKYDKKTGFTGRPREFPAHPRILGVARKVRRDKAWINRIRDPADRALPERSAYPVAYPPLGHIAPAVSTESVVASKSGDLAEMIALHYGDACVVEMEGYGAIYAASQELKPAIVIRGISDMTEHKDPASDHIRQPIAACHAAAFAFELLVQWGQYYSLDSTGPSTTDEAGLSATGSAAISESPAAIARASYVLNIDADRSTVTPQTIAEIEALLRQVTNDPDLTIERVEEGSLRLIVNSSTNAIANVTLRQLRQAFDDNFKLQLQGIVPEHELSDLHEIAQELEHASNDLLSWPTTLPDGEWLERPELLQILKLSGDNDCSATTLIGPPGSGKSALLATLGRTLVAQGHPVLAIKADLLPTTVNNEADLRESLGLSDRPSALLTRLAAFRPTYLLVDQLDALAGYLDLRTGRLSALLNLIRRLGRQQNIHIVLSARTFEYEHDVRLRSIAAESVELQLPAWSQVLALLESKHIRAAGWPADAQEVLRSPQALTTYLQLSERHRSEPLSSYHAMLDRLWVERVLRGPSGVVRSQMLGTIADAMAEEESLWLPRTRFEDENGNLDALIASGILTANTLGLSIGFAHQTMFDHALARAYSQERGRLSSYVLERQSSLFVRPKIWAALSYLRATDSQIYETELTSLWTANDLRRHLRLLLIDFLGQQTNPSDEEALLMERALRTPDERALAFRAMAGSSGWFKRFARSYGAEAMRAGPPAADWVLNFLTSAWSSDPTSITSLLTDCWLSDATNDVRVWATLQQAPVWNDELLEIAKVVLGRTDINQGYIDQLVAEIGVEQPDVAMRLLRMKLDRDLWSAKVAAAAKATEAEHVEQSVRETLAWSLASDPRQPIKALLEDGNSWDSVPALAERAPHSFTETLWPWFLETLTSLQQHSRDIGSALGFPLPYDADFRFEDEHKLGLTEPSLLSAARMAVERLSANEPLTFRAWAAANMNVNLTPVQRLISHGFAANASEFACDAYEFLTRDYRRWYLGSIEDYASTSVRLITAASDHWSEVQIRDFENLVWNFKPSAPAHIVDAEGKRAWQNVIRRLRIKLLRALPARRASEPTQRRLFEEERVFADPSLGVTFSGARYIGSIMSAADMRRASDGELLNAFKTLPDATAWHHPGDWGRGGNIQLAREFANFAKTDYERAFRLIERFGPDFGSRAAGYALEAMSDAADATQLIETILDLDRRGFETDEFRSAAARTIQRLVSRDVEIGSPVVDLLRRWLASMEHAAQTSDETEDGSNGDDESRATDDDVGTRSVLWGLGGFSVVPGGAYPVLEALVNVHLRRNEIHELDISLSAAAERITDKQMWRHLLLPLVNVRPRDIRSVAQEEKLLERVLDGNHEFTGTYELAYLLAHIHWWASALVERQLTKWKTQRGRRERRGYGELVALMLMLHPERDWAGIQIEEILNSPDDEFARAGVATTAVNLWADMKYRARATELLIRLLPKAGAPEWAAIVDLFRLVDDLAPERHTIILLEAIADHIDNAPRFNSTFIVERLETLLPHEALLVARIAGGLVRKWREELADVRTSTALVAPQLVDVAVTLHRLGADTREAGIRLFEQLLELNAYSARSTLDEIDNRFRSERAFRRPRLPRRNRVRSRRAGAA